LLLLINFSKSDYDDTFEGVLRNEMTIMKMGYEKKLKCLNDKLSSTIEDFHTKTKDREHEVLELRTTNESMFRRIKELVNKVIE
jgi:hypothetical protein